MLQFLDQIIYTIAQLDNYCVNKTIIKHVNAAYGEDIDHNIITNVKTYQLYRKHFNNIPLTYRYDLKILSHIYENEPTTEDILTPLVIKLLILNQIELFKKIIKDHGELINQYNTLVIICVINNNFDCLHYLINIIKCNVKSMYVDYLNDHKLLNLMKVSIDEASFIVNIMYEYNLHNEKIIKIHIDDNELLSVFRYFNLLNYTDYNNLLIDVADKNRPIQPVFALYSAIITHNDFAIDFILNRYDDDRCNYQYLFIHKYPNDKKTLELLDYALNRIINKQIILRQTIRIDNIGIFNIYIKYIPWLKNYTIIYDILLCHIYYVKTNIKTMRDIINLYPYKAHNTRLVEYRLRNNIIDPQYIKHIINCNFHVAYIHILKITGINTILDEKYGRQPYDKNELKELMLHTCNTPLFNINYN